MQKAPLIGWEDRPDWIGGPCHPRYRGFLVISDDLVFCLRNYGTRREEHVMVSTVLVPEPEAVSASGLPPALR